MQLQDAINFINASLAPAVLVTGVGLLLAGLQSKYSTLVGVIRQLNAERRNLEPLSPSLNRVSKQIDSLMQRARLVRNAIFCFYATVVFLVFSSIALGIGVLSSLASTILVFILFGISLAFLFVGLGYATREAILSYRIVQLETSDE
ncbi:DUF2721 domain-containing protein [Pelagicoccus sp. SDUM812005]|uniref:DUF2721 domain-containing protein n=1 Tax=Pelagicoccus sp. SDUM812005 TaxID=3041257 RepID=UPI00280D5D69|nr:DUF2721 domain-containing protein [Pelagicoccus sp. SDUM812005]MDQ8183231.1 DUF2721 domain-containing protein [Pelagicoccus sp. SDUM812005]